jgi:hypothetical protein
MVRSKSEPTAEPSLWEQYGVPHNEDLYPRKLLERMVEWGLPKEGLELTPAFDRVLMMHVMPKGYVKIPKKNPDDPSEKTAWGFLGSGSIVMPASSETREKDMAPRGFLVSAGAAGLEQLRTNGINLGDYVYLIRLSPYRLAVGRNSAGLILLTATRAQDIIASEDKVKRIEDGKILRKWTQTNKFSGYVYETAPGFENDSDANFIPGASTPSAPTPYEDM